MRRLYSIVLKILSAGLASLFVFCGCRVGELIQSISPTSTQLSSVPTTSPASNQDTSEKATSNILKIEIDGKTFTAKLNENPSTKAFKELLPMTIQMGDMNSNEKYYYLQTTLPTDSKKAYDINSGDIMLYGEDCLVLFYKSFSSSYSYTKLGTIDNPSDFSKEISSGLVTVTLS